MVIHSTSNTDAAKKAANKALVLVKSYESGKEVLDMAKYEKAIDILATSEIESVFFKVRPLFTPRLKALLTLIRRFLNEHASPAHSRKVTSLILKLNRKLSHYAQQATWREEMHLLAILQFGRPYAFFNPKYLEINLKAPLFDQTIHKSFDELFKKSPDFKMIIFEKKDTILDWKERVTNFLEAMTDVKTAIRLMYLVMEAEALRSLFKALNKDGSKAWKESSGMSIEDQLWYYSRIEDYFKFTAVGDKADPNIDIALNEIRSFMGQIRKKVKRVGSEVVPTETQV